MASSSGDRSPRLYNQSLAPEAATGTWKTSNLIFWWMSAWHSLGGYTTAIGLFALGLMGWQIMVAFAVAIVILYFVNNASGIAGQRTKVPFPVFARASFGVYGANIPAVLRAVVAVAWYGIQTFLASVAIKILIVKVWPSTNSLDHGNILGLSALGWFCFLGLSLAQLVILLGGMESIRRVCDFAGPTIWVAFIALAIWIFARADWSINLTHAVGRLHGAGSQTLGLVSGIFLMVAYMAGPSLNFPDFTRNSPTEQSVRKGNAIGLLINAVAFGIVAIVIALAAVEVYGKPIDDPVVILKDLDNVALLLVSVIAIAISAAGINIILNFVSPVYDLINVWPKRLTFRKSGTIVAILAVVIMPWNIFSNPVVVNQFIGAVGALMGPLFGIIYTDYYILRKGHVWVEELFTDRTTGQYHYRSGFNPKAIVSLVIAGGVTVILTVVPWFASWAPLAWPVGVLAGAAIYYFLNQHDIRASNETRETVPATE